MQYDEHVRDYRRYCFQQLPMSDLRGTTLFHRWIYGDDWATGHPEYFD